MRANRHPYPFHATPAPAAAPVVVSFADSRDEVTKRAERAIVRLAVARAERDIFRAERLAPEPQPRGILVRVGALVWGGR